MLDLLKEESAEMTKLELQKGLGKSMLTGAIGKRAKEYFNQCKGV